MDLQETAGKFFTCVISLHFLWDFKESSLIVDQPARSDATRRQIPVYTVGWSSTTGSQMLPVTGLDFLTGVHQVALQQTVTSRKFLNFGAIVVASISNLFCSYNAE